MPWFRPTPQQHLQNIQSEIGPLSLIRNSVENVIARVVAMVMHEIYGFMEFIARQILPITAEAEFLQLHADTWDITKKDASPASGTVQFSGINGTIIPAGTTVKRADNIEYVIDGDMTVTGGTASGTVTAATAGLSANAATGTKLALLSPIAGVSSEGTVSAPGLVGGADIETDEYMRGRLLERIHQPPHGGAKHDYIAWAKSRPGVTRAWCYPEQYGPGTVGVSFVMDNKIGTIIPSGPEVTDVADYIDTIQPATAHVHVFAPVAEPVNFSINLSPNTVAIQTAVKAEIEDLFKREAEPGGILYLSRIREAVSIATGEYDNAVVSPNANIEPDFGDLPVVGTFTFGNI